LNSQAILVGEPIVDDQQPSSKLTEMFPNIRPISSPPALFTVNGCGLSIYGRRDDDPATGAYVKTWCLTFVFVPILALGAYRVLAAPGGGWYFLGKEPLSLLAKAWNGAIALTLAAVIGFSWWSAHAASPEVIAQKKMQQAEQHVAQGQLVEAAVQYRDVAMGSTSLRTEAKAALKTLVEGLSAETPKPQVIGLITMAAKHAENHNWVTQPGQVYAQVRRLVQQYSQTDPAAALKVLDLSQGFVPEASVEDHSSIRFDLLEKVVAADPENVELVSELAMTYEARGDVEEARRLLQPLRDRLGDSEGARILGQILVNEGDYENAYALLSPYCDSHLKELQQAEANYDERLESIWTTEVENVNQGLAPQSFYDRANMATDDEIDVMVREYVEQKVRQNEEMKRLQAQLLTAAEITPVALDLGFLQLQRGQAMTDPAEKEAELLKAEKTFLSIQGYASESDEFRLSLGQVYFWLGKQEEGNKLFEEQLTAHNREPQWLVAVAQIKRQLGGWVDARALLEEAYETSSDEKEKQHIASARARTPLDVEDSILWLERSDTQQLDQKATLLSAKASLAIRNGDRQEGIDLFRQSLEIQNSFPETSTTLNNAAIVYMQLHATTGDAADFEEGMRRLQKALSLEPDNALVLINVTSAIWPAAVIDFLGDRWPSHKHVSIQPGFNLRLLAMFHDSAEQSGAMADELKTHAGMQTAVKNLERLTLLSPNSTTGYEGLKNYYAFTSDLAGLKRLRSRLDQAHIDTSDSESQIAEYLSGAKDEVFRVQFSGFVEDMRRERKAAFNGPEDPAGRAVASDKLCLALLASSIWNDVSTDEVVALAEEAYELLPSSGSRRLLSSALFHRALDAVAQADPALEARRISDRRRFNDNGAIAMWLQDPSPATAIQENADFQRGCELLVEQEEKYPKSAYVGDWAILRHTHPDLAERMEELLLNNDQEGAERAVSRRIEPHSLSTSLDDYWFAVLQDQPAKAEEALRRFDPEAQQQNAPVESAEATP